MMRRCILWIGYPVIVILLFLLAFMSIRSTTDITDRFEGVITHPLKKYAVVNSMYRSTRERYLSMANLVVVRDPFDRDEQLRQIDKYTHQYIVSRQELISLGLGPQEKEILDIQDQAVRTATDTSENMSDLLVQGDETGARELLQRDGMRQQKTTSKMLLALADLQYQAIQDAMEDARLIKREGIRSTVFTTILLIGMIVLLGHAIARRLRDAARRLEQQNTQLEDRVQLRTRDLSDAKNYLQRILDNMQEGVVVLDEDFKVRSINPAIEKMFGYPAERIIGDTLALLYPSDERYALQASLIRDKLLNQQIYEDEVDLQDRNGEPVIVHCVQSGFRSATGDRLILKVLRDVTARKEDENRIKSQQAMLAHAGRINSMGEMAAGIAHELNQPLTAISSSEQLIGMVLSKGNIKSAEIQEWLGVIAHQVDVASGVIQHMREFAHPRPDIKRGLIDLRKPVEDALSFFHEQLRVNDIELIIELEDQVLLVTADPNRIEQIIVNFISNAHFALNEKETAVGERFEKRIWVRLRVDEARGFVVLEVEDNGVGMDDETRERCMEPFFTTKPVGQGTGLGMAVVNGIVRDASGFIEIESQFGVGTCIRVLLPATAPSEPAG